MDRREIRNHLHIRVGVSKYSLRRPQRPLKVQEGRPNASVTSISPLHLTPFLTPPLMQRQISKVHTNENRFVMHVFVTAEKLVCVAGLARNAQCETERRALVGCDHDVGLPK